jgi:hypothetical protein
MNSKLYDSLKNELHLADDQAKRLAGAIEEVVNERINLSRPQDYTTKHDLPATRQDLLATKHDIAIVGSEIRGTIYMVALIQFLATTSTLAIIISLLLRHFRP